MGEILRQFQAEDPTSIARSSKNPCGVGGRPTEISQRQAAEAAGISKHQEKRAVAVSHVPEETFDQMVEAEKPPTVVHLHKVGKEERDKKEPERRQ